MSAGSERTATAFVEQAMAASRFAAVEWVSETGSTNHDLMERADDGAGEQVLITDMQTAGRGRRGRMWTAPPATSILMSILLRGQEPADAFWSVGAIALAAAEAATEELGVATTLKWPNDLLIGEAKVAGVLAQIGRDAMVVGIGMNTNWPIGAEVPTHGSLRPTSLNWHLPPGESVDRAELIVSILRRAETWLATDRTALRQRWQANCSTIGNPVRLDLGDSTVTGRAIGVADNGALGLDTAHGRRYFEAGDVVHLRSAE